MSGKKRAHVEQESGEELNLTPFLDVLITLIPFLMLTASFFSVVVVEAKLPVPINAENMDQIPVPPPFDLVVQVPKDSIKIFVNNKNPLGPPQFSVVTKDVADSSSYSKEQLEAFYKILVDIKKQYPKETRLALDPIGSLQLEKLAQLIDRSRTFANDDPVLTERPEFKANGLNLFPAIAMKGVYVP